MLNDRADVSRLARIDLEIEAGRVGVLFRRRRRVETEAARVDPVSDAIVIDRITVRSVRKCLYRQRIDAYLWIDRIELRQAYATKPVDTASQPWHTRASGA